MTFRGVRVTGPCRGCGALVFNGLTECLLPITAGSSKSRTMMPETVGGGGSALSTLAAIFRNEGYAGLYAGLRPTLVTSVPNTVLYFTAYDEISARLRRRDQDTTNANNIMGGGAAAELLAGSSARLLASLATAPLELIRTRQASFVASNNTNSRPPGMMEEFWMLT
mmetsp:Transcript_32447/g.78539  ORF Transcript_32447/g.78539 Transcript_32447/m.78539 type:complete len:167 (+) Transcript_32447:1802-2302(+)